MSTAAESALAPPSASSEPLRLTTSGRSQRVLACVLCQQRKIKCDRRFPCSHCTKAGVQCVPAALLPRQRRRRFPERELLDKLRHYEDLLRRHDVPFDPLHPGHVGQSNSGTDARDLGSPDDAISTRGDGARTGSKVIKMETVYRPKSVWDALNQRPQGSDEDYDDDYEDDDEGSYNRSPHGMTDQTSGTMQESTVQKAMDLTFQSNDHLLFGSPSSAVALATLHPPQAQIFRLWQLYLDNVNPILKITHIPTLQTRILDAAADVSNISPVLEALMFSIYCVTIMTLEEETCMSMFGTPTETLLATYQSACQQSLNRCGLLRTMDRDCLTAYFLYLVSAKYNTDPRSISSMLGVAIRIAQRMGINMDSMYGKCSPFETEMRRRLWWALVMFDARICEQSNWRASSLNPTWQCTIPLNISDYDLRPEMTSLPQANDRPSEAIFAVTRSELCDYIRHSDPHLDFTNPALKGIAKPMQDNDQISTLEKTIEEKYLQFCNPENPLHFMTLWSTRYNLAHMRLLEYYSKTSKDPSKQTIAERNSAFIASLGMLESGTRLLKSPLAKCYMWQVQLYFPFLAYMFIVKDLKKRPLFELAGRAWSAVREDYETRHKLVNMDESPLLGIFSQTILSAWEAREAAVRERGMAPEPLVPMIIDARRRAAAANLDLQTPIPQRQGSDFGNADMADFTNLMPMNINLGLPFDLGQESPSFGAEQYTAIPGQAAWMDIDFGNIDWTKVDWTSMSDRGW